jgi:hypothetical protein
MNRMTAQGGKSRRRGIVFHPHKRYGNPHALRALTAGLWVRQIAKMLHRHPRTIRDWLSERRPAPYWAVELLELRHAAYAE